MQRKAGEHIRHVIICVMLIASFNTSHAQSEKSETLKSTNNLNFAVELIGQFPNSKVIQNKKGLRGRLVDLFFGKEQYVLSKPIAIYASNLDTFWILDQANGVVLRVQNEIGDIPQCVKRKKEGFKSLVDFCSLPNSKLLFTDSQLNKIFQIKDKTISDISKDILLKQPTGITYLENSNTIWVVETTAHRVTILDMEGNIVNQIGKRGSNAGEFNYPTAICSNHNGTVYIVDAMNFRIQAFSEDGEWLSEFGQLGDATGYFSRPKGIAVDSYGHIYVSDALFNNVQIFDRKGTFLYQFGEQGHNSGQFWMPSGIFIDKQDNIYVADSYNSRIQMFKLIINE